MGRRSHQALIEALERTELYSEQLGIDLSAGTEQQLFRWFLASLLYGGHITETIARHTYQAFARHQLLTPRRILDVGWEFLVHPVMREGGYVRYDGRKSEQILRDCEQLLRDYGGCLQRVHDESADARDLERRVTGFFGVGPVTANIFLRELRPYWARADPAPLPSVRAAARRLHLSLSTYDRKSLRFVRLEAGLVRRRRELTHAARLRAHAAEHHA